MSSSLIISTKRSNHIAPLINKHGDMWVGEILKCDPGRLRMKNYVIGFESQHTTIKSLVTNGVSKVMVTSIYN